ncbi:MAG TPA: hypothetical protein VJH70_02585 [Candidatus Paceibacterota bacterium]
MLPPAIHCSIQRAIQKLSYQRKFRNLNSLQWKRAEELAYDAVKNSNDHPVNSPAYAAMIENLLASKLTQVRHRLF